MLSALMKYERKATARVMVPILLAVVLLAAVLRLLSVWSGMISHSQLLSVDPVDLLLSIVTIVFFMAMVAAPIAALVLMIVRFKTNLLSDEGYVMFTLPVSAHQLVWSKLLTSALWFIAAAAVDALGILVIAGEQEQLTAFIRDMQEAFQNLTAYYAANGILMIAEIAVLVLIFCLVTCLRFYCPMAIGHSFARRKVFLSVVFYFIIWAATQAAVVTLATLGVPFLDDLSTLLMGLPSAVTFHGGVLLAILVLAVYGAILYGITVRMLHRHLNLD